MASDGDPLPYAPKWSTSLDGEYDWNLIRRLQGLRRCNWSYVGSRHTDFESFPLITMVPNGQLELNSYNTFDARIGIDNAHYRVTLYGKNLGDTRGITNYYNASDAGRRVIITVIQPRTYGADAEREILGAVDMSTKREPLRGGANVGGVGSASAVLLFLGDTTEPGYAKTAFGLRDWARSLRRRMVVRRRHGFHRLAAPSSERGAGARCACARSSASPTRAG